MGQSLQSISAPVTKEDNTRNPPNYRDLLRRRRSKWKDRVWTEARKVGIGRKLL